MLVFTVFDFLRLQWRTQDFPEMGAPTLGGGGSFANILFCQNFAKKTAWNWKKFGPHVGGGGTRQKCYYVDPVRPVEFYWGGVGW